MIFYYKENGLFMLRYVKYKSQQGLALITVLIFLQVLAVLGLYALEMSLLEEKMSRHSWQRQFALVAAEEALHRAEAEVDHGLPACQIPVTPTNELVTWSLAQWQSSISCAGNFSTLQYYYVIEFLGKDNCADIKQSGYATKKITADYFRITLLITTLAHDAEVMLQSTIVKPSDVSQTCHGTEHVVSVGRQSWRDLSVIPQRSYAGSINIGKV